MAEVLSTLFVIVLLSTPLSRAAISLASHLAGNQSTMIKGLEEQPWG